MLFHLVILLDTDWLSKLVSQLVGSITLTLEGLRLLLMLF